MVERAALADIDRRIQIVEDNLYELIEQAAAYSGAADETMPIASPTSRRNWMRF